MDEQENVSLIVLLTAVRIGLNVASVPEDSAIPMRWDIVTMWWRTPDDTAKLFEQRIELVGPENHVLLKETAEIPLDSADTHRHIHRVAGFPIPRVPGRCFLRLYLREKRDRAAWGDPVSIYPMTVEVSLQDPKSVE
jgi:hypothetical protein